LKQHDQARFFPRFRLPISATGVGPVKNWPAAAFRVRSRKLPPALAIVAPHWKMAATTVLALRDCVNIGARKGPRKFPTINGHSKCDWLCANTSSYLRSTGARAFD
jgi:hypothetical protein